MFYGILEIEIMNTLWNLHEQNEDANVSVTDIVQALSDNSIERAYTTIKTVMDRLVIKGILVRYRNNKKFFYRCIMDRDEASKNAIENVAKQFFNGSHVQMLRFIERECESLLR